MRYKVARYLGWLIGVLFSLPMALLGGGLGVWAAWYIVFTDGRLISFLAGFLPDAVGFLVTIALFVFLGANAISLWLKLFILIIKKTNERWGNYNSWIGRLVMGMYEVVGMMSR